MPVTGERSQLVVGKGILQVAVVGVVEHGLDSRPGAGYEKCQRATKRNQTEERTRIRAENGNHHLISARSPVAGSQQVGGVVWDGGNGEGTRSGIPIPQLWKGGEPDPLHL